MPNDLTGEFDIVAQFAIPAVNRMLAAMHRAERFPHSATLRVDDITPPPHQPPRPSLTAVMDAYGDAVVNHQRIGRPGLRSPGAEPPRAAFFRFDPVVNPDIAGVEVAPIVPSNLQGRAQVQLFPPTLEISDPSGANITVKLELMVRYFPDPNTSRAAQFIRGTVKITAPVNQDTSQIADIVGIDIGSSAVRVEFNPVWSSTPLSAEDRAGIDLLIKNALRTSFLPSNAAIPLGAKVQLKGMQGAQPAVAVLLNTDGQVGNRASATNLFLGAGDLFAFGVGADFIRAKFQPILDDILAQPIDPVTFQRSIYIHTWTITYTVTLSSATVDLQAGKIVLTITGHAHTGTSWMPDFDFTVKQPFTLAVNGPSADLVVGQMSLDTSSWVINLFKGGATSNIAAARDKALSDNDAAGTVNRMLSADENLGGFLSSVLAPPEGKPIPSYTEVDLSYTSVDIRPSGIVLHGMLGVAQWPLPRVEYELLPPGQGSIVSDTSVLDDGPDYSALNSWIPGGTIDRYEWTPAGSSQGYADANRFVFLHPPPMSSDGVVAARVVGGHSPMCLTVYGTRISASGPAVSTPVTASFCGFRSFPIMDDWSFAMDGKAPLLALTEPAASGRVHLLGHASPSVGMSAGQSPNLILHFASTASTDQHDVLMSALRRSGRNDAPTSVVLVVPSGSVENARYVDGVTYAEDDGAWSQEFGVTREDGPVTMLIEPGGKTVWKHAGEIDGGEAAAVLRERLVSRSAVRPAMRTARVRIGYPPPNFLFEHAPGKRVTLRKLEGRETTLLFCSASSGPSIEALRESHRMAREIKPRGHVMLAILDGEDREASLRLAKQFGLSGAVIPDPDHSISQAYGISVWPTTIFLDSSGIVRRVEYGRTSEASTSGSRTPKR